MLRWLLSRFVTQFLFALAVGLWDFARPVRAQAPEQTVDRLFDAFNENTPGCAIGVLQDGSVVLKKGYGSADLEHHLPITPESFFYMASVSKQFTAMSVLLAEQEGKLKLTDSIRKYVPELPSYADGVTIHRMLDHTAGLRDVLDLWDMKGWSTESVLREEPSIALIARQKALDFRPGDAYSYSNTGYLLAGVALKRATGQSLGQLAAERIFVPLEMEGTRYEEDHGKPIQNRAYGYTKRDGEWRTANLNFDLVGSGGLYSNVDGMLKWLRNYEQPRVGAGVMKAMETPQLLNDGKEPGAGYALGLEREQIGGMTVYTHSGSAIGYSTFLLRVPEKSFGLVCLCNSGGADVRRLGQSIASAYTGMQFPERKEGKLPAKAVRKPVTDSTLAGTYWSPELETVWRLAMTDGKLTIHNEGGAIPVEQDEEGRLHARVYTILPTAAGFLLSDPRARNIEFDKR